MYEIKTGKGNIDEYDDNGKLEFEGEICDGERNGKGKDYKLKYEEEYLRGKKHGKGREFYDNYILKFEGEYLKGKRNGKGKEYYYNGNLKFEGEYLNGKKWNGKGYNLIGNFEYEIKDGKGYTLF